MQKTHYSIENKYSSFLKINGSFQKKTACGIFANEEETTRTRKNTTCQECIKVILPVLQKQINGLADQLLTLEKLRK